MKNSLRNINQNKVNDRLHDAVIKNQLKVVETLLKNGADVNAQDEDRKTPLHHFSAGTDLGIVQLLLESKPDLNKRDQLGETSLFAAVRTKNSEIVRLLIDHGADVKISNLNDEITPLHLCWSDPKIAETLLEKRANVNAQDYDGNTLLHFSVDRPGTVETVRLLLKYEADVNVKNKEGETPLFDAVRNGNFESFKLLVDRGADIKIVNPYGSTALHEACDRGRHNEIIKCLLDKGAVVNAKDQHGYTPLHHLARDGTVEAVELLLSFKAEVNIKNEHGSIALLTAASEGNSEVVKLLVDRGSDVNNVNSDGITALHSACCIGDLEMVKYLMKNSANVNIVDLRGSPPMTEAVQYSVDDENLIKFLFKYANPVDFMREDILKWMKPDYLKRVLKYLAILQSLNILDYTDIFDTISQNREGVQFFEKCTDELAVAKSTKLQNCWVTFFNLMLDNKIKLKNYAGNQDLVEQFKKCDVLKKFPIYGAWIKENVQKGIRRRDKY